MPEIFHCWPNQEINTFALAHVEEIPLQSWLCSWRTAQKIGSDIRKVSVVGLSLLWSSRVFFICSFKCWLGCLCFFLLFLFLLSMILGEISLTTVLQRCPELCCTCIHLCAPSVQHLDAKLKWQKLSSFYQDWLQIQYKFITLSCHFLYVLWVLCKFKYNPFLSNCLELRPEDTEPVEEVLPKNRMRLYSITKTTRTPEVIVLMVSFSLMQNTVLLWSHL